MTYQHQSQWANRFDPSSSCVLTCLSMALSVRGKTVTADELWLAAKSRKWNRLEPETVDKLSILHGKPYRIRKDLSLSELKPGTILYGGWTAGGHCVLLIERLNSSLIYNDPLGVMKDGRYDFNVKGERQNVANEICTKYIGKPGEIWGHLPV